MAIDRYKLISRHNPHLKEIDYKSALTIGNGGFAFTADVTGLQTMYKEYLENGMPLCTMSQWGWHTIPADNDEKRYTLKDLAMTEYDHAGRRVLYAVDKKSGYEKIYNWLRENPHRFNLGRLSLYCDGRRISSEDITDICQRLDLYEGILDSSFILHGVPVRVLTCCHPSSDTLAVKIKSELLDKGLLEAGLSFPYGSSDITGSDWEAWDRHETQICEKKIDCSKDMLLCFKRRMDDAAYYAIIGSDSNLNVRQAGQHEYYFSIRDDKRLSFTLTYSQECPGFIPSVTQTFQESCAGWRCFWNSTGVIDLHNSADSRAMELERRIILSQYQSAVQDLGPLPPQETGLTCNSWHGKFHLEMHLWHQGYLPLWNLGKKLIPVINWYIQHLPQAKENAGRNGYAGARWPKQTAYDGVDSPSPIATLLIWQQPSIIYMLETMYQIAARKEADGECSSYILNKYWILVKETADFMVDYAVYNRKDGIYELLGPLIPAQEVHDAMEVANPVFELEYWRFTLQIALKWAKRMDKHTDMVKWSHAAQNMAGPPVKDGLYLAHKNCPLTFESFNKDHPMMLGIYGLIGSDRANPDIMRNTLNKVLECWDFSTMWGWDFAMMAMTAVRLGMPEQAIDLLLMDLPNNRYSISGSNTQDLRKELPVYLPGNGSLLLAAAIMTAGYYGCLKDKPGFPDNGLWAVEYEDIYPML